MQWTNGSSLQVFDVLLERAQFNHPEVIRAQGTKLNMASVMAPIFFLELKEAHKKHKKQQEVLLIILRGA